MIFYADESGFLLNPPRERTYAPKGEPPLIPCWDKQFNTYGVCGAISPQGDFIYTHQTQSFKGEDMVEFLQKLLGQIDSPITLIWDGASIHSCKAVREFLDTLPEGRLKLVQQPPYSPELNASEQVWKHLKYESLKLEVFKNTDQLAQRISQALEQMKEEKKLIKRFFHHPEVAFY